MQIRKKKAQFVGLLVWLTMKSRQHIPSLLPSANCQFQPYSPKRKFCLSKYDHIPEGLKSLGWLDIPYKLNFNEGKMMYR